MRLPVKVLIVEDDAIAAKMAMMMLESFDFELTHADSSQSALTYYQTESYPLILMDIGLGQGMDGALTAREIRKIEQHQHRTPAVIYALTAHATEKDDAFHNSMGINKTLQKPLDKSMIEAIVRDNPKLWENKPTKTLINIDIDQIAKSRFDGNVELAMETLQAFKQNLSKALPELEELYRAKRHREVIDLVYKLHGSATYVDATPIIEHATALENSQADFSDSAYRQFVRTCLRYLH